MNRRTVYTIVIGILIFFVFFNPFKRNRDQNINMPFVSSQIVDELTEELTNNKQTPEAYLVSLFRRHKIVFAGEYGHIRQQVEVVSKAIPLLYEAGVRNLGIEYALFEDTSRIDEILTDEVFDEDGVREILFRRMVISGYSEYVDMFRSAWELNRRLPDGGEPFRIVGINVPIAWEELIDERGMEDPEVIARVYREGIPDEFMAATIIAEFVRKDQKALVFVGFQHAFTSFVTKEYAERAAEVGLDEDRRAGNIVYDRIGKDAATVLFHAPWPYRRAQTLLSFPVDGAIDRLIKKLPEELLYAGFDVVETPFADLDADRSDFAYEYDDLTLGDISDGYIITGPLAEYEPVTIIPDFINESNIDEAVRLFPGPTIGEAISVEDMNGYIGSILDSRKKILERFK